MVRFVHFVFFVVHNLKKHTTLSISFHRIVNRMKHRIEKDTMGEVRVPADKLWGAQTQRSLENFPIGPAGSMPIEVLQAFGYLKKAAAFANCDLNILPPEKRDLVATVCDEIIAGKLDDQFPLVIWQTGSGTQTNMNVNEVIANRAHCLQGLEIGKQTRILHPNDDVNRSQSSNDTFPTAMHIAAVRTIEDHTVPAVKQLHKAFTEKSEQFKAIVKIGRTHCMDATPLTLGQEFSGYASQLSHGLKALQNSLNHLRELAIGGTAVGTGLNSPKGYDLKVVEHINRFTGLQFTPAPNKFEALASHDALVSSHGSLKQLAVSLMKIANDIRLLSSGPRCGLGEIFIPANEPGSSIMPGKVNPTQVEALSMVCAQIMGNDTAVTIGCASGHFELNVFKPLIIYNFLQSASLLADACNSFHDRCINGIKPNEPRIREHLNNSLMLVTALSPHIGYENAAKIAKAAAQNGTTLKKEALNLGLVSEEEFAQWVKPEDMTHSS